MTDPSRETSSVAGPYRNVVVLVLAQSFLGAQMPILFMLGGLAGQSLASNACLATLPLSLIVVGSMAAATPMSTLMQKHGRRAGFVVGAIAGALGGAISAYGLLQQSFALYLLGSFVTGIYMSAHGFYRFAAGDTASEEFRPKAISYVMAGGLVAAVIGPQLATATADALATPFLGSYLAVIAINVVGALLFVFLDIPVPDAVDDNSPPGRTRMELLRSPVVVVAIICAMVSYALMNLVMTSTPLAVVGCGYQTANAGHIVTSHVLAMFAPSFFTGHLIVRFGAKKIIAIGLFILAGAGMVALQGVQLSNFFIALILLGIGWNFGFIGATALLASAHDEHEQGRVQGLNDMIVFGGVTFASLASGGLMNCIGGDAQQGWQAVNLAMIPFLSLAGVALVWLVRQESRPAQL